MGCFLFCLVRSLFCLVLSRLVLSCLFLIIFLGVQPGAGVAGGDERNCLQAEKLGRIGAA